MINRGSFIIVREIQSTDMVQVTHAIVTLCYLDKNDKVTHIDAEGIAGHEISGHMMDNEMPVLFRAMPVADTEYSSVEIVKS